MLGADVLGGLRPGPGAHAERKSRVLHSAVHKTLAMAVERLVKHTQRAVEEEVLLYRAEFLADEAGRIWLTRPLNVITCSWQPRVTKPTKRTGEPVVPCSRAARCGSMISPTPPAHKATIRGPTPRASTARETRLGSPITPSCSGGNAEIVNTTPHGEWRRRTERSRRFYATTRDTGSQTPRPPRVMTRAWASSRWSASQQRVGSAPASRSNQRNAYHSNSVRHACHVCRRVHQDLKEPCDITTRLLSYHSNVTRRPYLYKPPIVTEVCQNRNADSARIYKQHHSQVPASHVHDEGHANNQGQWARPAWSPGGA